MIKKPDYILYDRPPIETNRGLTAESKVYPPTPGLWQQESLDTLRMYSPGEGNFSPVSEQLTLFPMDPVAPAAKLDLDAPDLPVAYASDFRFLAQDTIRQLQAAKPTYVNARVEPAHAKDAVSATDGELYVPGKTEIKADDFPGRVHYTEGGLYPPGDKSDPQVIARHSDAPNYRKMPGKPVHGVGQPTKQGFRDVLTRAGGKSKPVVWTNTRAEAVIYLKGKPYNLRELAAQENLVLKEGATGAEIEALEEELKKRLIARGSVEVVKELPDASGRSKSEKERITFGPGDVQTTRDVIDEMRAEGFQVEYRRVPLVDEKSPTPAQIDELRGWMNEMKAKHPDADLEYVFNCHQGRGRTTTGMVAAGIALDGQTKQLELPFGIKLGEDSRGRADRIIDENFHMQNLRETVDETKKKAAAEETKAKQLEERAARENDPDKKAQLERDAEAAWKKKAKYDTNATDFTKRYALMQKYSEYIDQFGAGAKTPSFEEWMGQTAQQNDLQEKWASLNSQLGLTTEPAVALA